MPFGERKAPALSLSFAISQTVIRVDVAEKRRSITFLLGFKDLPKQYMPEPFRFLHELSFTLHYLYTRISSVQIEILFSLKNLQNTHKNQDTSKIE